MTESALYTYNDVIAHVRNVNKLMEEVLLEKPEWFPFTTESTDGRRNSMQSETMVADYLLKHPKLTGLLCQKASKAQKKTKEDASATRLRSSAAQNEGLSHIFSSKANENEENNRAFGDIGICLKHFGIMEPFPCNIKIISAANKAGNNSCGLTSLIAYTFNTTCSNHDNVMETLISLETSGYSEVVPKLYGIIMIMKEHQKVWVGTFDEVPEKCIGTNPSNPLQICFLTERVARTSSEYIAMLISKIVEYYEKKSKPYAMWIKHKQRTSL
jgi:hypothetical protein